MANTNNLNKESEGYHQATRWLHAGLVLGVVFQLTCAAFMSHPDHDESDHGEHAGVVTHTENSSTLHSSHQDMVSITTAAQAQPVLPTKMPAMDMEKGGLNEWLMDAHRTAGILVALIVLANLIWAIMLRGKPRKRQIAVLFSRQHWSESAMLLRQLPFMLIGKKPMPEPGNSLSLIVEMFGMLTMTAMAVSGAIIWGLWAGVGNKVSESAELWMGVHGSIAILLFLYLLGHVSMALLHWRSGDSVFTRILPIALKK